MKKAISSSVIVLTLLSTLFLIFGAGPPVKAVLSSSNVLVVLTPSKVGSWPGSASVHGGTLPTLDPAFSGFTFSVIGFPSLSAVAIGDNDTVVLVVSYTTDISGLTSGQKTLLNDFVYNGGKLIIYDSETIPSVDYSWLVYPMTTKNPGPMGYPYSPIIFVENNSLGSTDPLSPYYIDITTAPTGAWSDYVVDCNTFVSADPNWCGDIKAQNYYSDPSSPGYDGSAANWTHTYARYGNGTLIYNGFDIDPMTPSLTPSSTGKGNCAKIWLMELQQPWGDDWNLPCAVSITGITLAPSSDTNPVGTSHTLTATVLDDLLNPVPGVDVTFEVISGPNVGVIDTDTTNANGEATVSYVGNTAGTDIIQASCYCPIRQTTIYSNTVEKIWQAAPPTPPSVGGHAAPIDKLSSPTPNVGIALSLVAAIFATIVLTWWRGRHRSRATIGIPKIGP